MYLVKVGTNQVTIVSILTAYLAFTDKITLGKGNISAFKFHKLKRESSIVSF